MITVLTKCSQYNHQRLTKYSLCVMIKKCYLHGQSDGVDHDEDKDAILKGLGCDEPPDLVLPPCLGDVAPDRLHLQCKLYTLSL